MNKKPLICCGIALLLGSGFLYAQSAGNAEAAAREASRRLDEALSNKTSGGGTVQARIQVSKGGPEPVWVIDPYKAYPRDRYIAAVGFAKNHDEAEKKALVELTAIFGQSIKYDYSAATVYSEAVSKGIVVVSDNTSVRDTIVSAVSLDTLIGAEIGNVWEDGRGIVYVLAYMDRGKTVAIYTEMIRVNNRNIELLTTMSDAEKHTFDGYARYKLASLIAGINAQYANIIVQAGGSTASLNLFSADSLNIEAANIYKNLAVYITIDGDRNNRIRYTFAKILNGEGWRIQENISPYTLKVTVNLNEVTFPNNKNKFCDFAVQANLVENATGLILSQFNSANRTSHLTYRGAADRAIAMIEKSINEQYSAALRKDVAVLLPRK